MHLRGLMMMMIAGLMGAGVSGAGGSPALDPVVEAEEVVYSFGNANNGSGPSWTSGNTCLVRVGDDLLASGIEVLADQPRLNNVRWILFKRTGAGWELQQADEKGRTREPSPLIAFPDGRAFLSVNPTLTAPGTEG